MRSFDRSRSIRLGRTDPHSPHAYAQLNSNPLEDLGQIVSSPWAMPWEQRNHIYLCHNRCSILCSPGATSNGSCADRRTQAWAVTSEVGDKWRCLRRRNRFSMKYQLPIAKSSVTGRERTKSSHPVIQSPRKVGIMRAMFNPVLFRCDIHWRVRGEWDAGLAGHLGSW